MEGPMGWRPNSALSGRQFWCLQQALSRWGVALCLQFPLRRCTSKMCSWDNQVNYLVHHHPTWGDEKTLHHLWIRKCSKSTQMMKHAVQGVHVQLPIMHTSKVLLIVQCMKALTCLSQDHLSSSMVLLSVESAATTTSTCVSASFTFVNLCFPLKNWHRAARSKQRGSTIKFRDEQFYQ